MPSEYWINLFKKPHYAIKSLAYPAKPKGLSNEQKFLDWIGWAEPGVFSLPGKVEIISHFLTFFDKNYPRYHVLSVIFLT